MNARIKNQGNKKFARPARVGRKATGPSKFKVSRVAKEGAVLLRLLGFFYWVRTPDKKDRVENSRMINTTTRRMYEKINFSHGVDSISADVV